MRKPYFILLTLLLCPLFVCIPLVSQADFGGFSGDSDFGGSDWGGSDWGSSDWDSDWGDSSSGPGIMLFGCGGGSLSWIVIIVVLILIFSQRNKRRGAKRTNGMPAGARRTPDTQLMPIAGYAALDSGFDTAAFEEKLSNLYVQMQNCWQEKDITPVRPYFTDALYQQMDRQLEMLRKYGRTNYIERITVLGVTLRGFYQRDGEDHMIAELRTRIVDYTLDDKTGKLVTGSKTAEKFMTYEWDLARTSGLTTNAQDAMSVINCPNCGAPVSMNQSAKCPYCDSVIELDTHDWAICAIKGVSQRTGR